MTFVNKHKIIFYKKNIFIIIFFKLTHISAFSLLYICNFSDKAVEMQTM